MSRSVCWWMVTFATFQNVPVPVQMVRTLLFINQIVQIWYQNEEDTHLLPKMLLISLIYNISGKNGLLEVSRDFFCWVYIVWIDTLNGSRLISCSAGLVQPRTRSCSIPQILTGVSPGTSSIFQRRYGFLIWKASPQPVFSSQAFLIMVMNNLFWTL